MDETLKLVGRFLSPDQGQRDAVHFAVLPVVMGSDAQPGQRVNVSKVGDTYTATTGGKYHGIVDPFLLGPVVEGDRVFVFLNPGSITGLRHVWTHDTIPD